MTNIKTVFALIATLSMSITSFAQETQWNVDHVHSSIGFSIDHLVVSETTGRFNDYSAIIKSDKTDFSDATFEVTIQAKSVDTKDKKRDAHLRNADFFDVTKYPTITFKSSKFTKVSDKKYKITGLFTMHGVSKEVTLDAKFGGIITDSRFGTRAGLKISGAVDRYDFDLKYNAAMEAGGLILGKEVRIDCRIELIKPKK
ncbi:YceI family protein [Spongiimicrobium salis]|uniref:YceI family protein n=1 Tax=Spongiimicrobium salis TaxID=1667022 RepID=UPI00374DE96A